MASFVKDRAMRAKNHARKSALHAFMGIGTSGDAEASPVQTKGIGGALGGGVELVNAHG